MILVSMIDNQYCRELLSIILSATQCYNYNTVKIVRIVVYKHSEFQSISNCIYNFCLFSSVTVSSHDILIIVFTVFMIYYDMKFLISHIPTLITSIVYVLYNSSVECYDNCQNYSIRLLVDHVMSVYYTS